MGRAGGLDILRPRRFTIVSSASIAYWPDVDGLECRGYPNKLVEVSTALYDDIMGGSDGAWDSRTLLIEVSMDRVTWEDIGVSLTADGPVADVYPWAYIRFKIAADAAGTYLGGTLRCEE